MFNIGSGEMIMLAVLALLVFGPESLPDIAKTVVRTIRAFRQASMDLQNEVKGALELETKQRRASEVIGPAPPITDDEVFQPKPKAVVADVESVESTEVLVEPTLESETLREDEASVQVESNEIPPPLVVAENEQVNRESEEDDDDGPGLPMTRPVRAVSVELDVEPPSEQDPTATPVETAS